MRCLVTLVHLTYFFLNNTHVWRAQATLSSLAYIGGTVDARTFLFLHNVEVSCFIYRRVHCLHYAPPDVP